jgi:hypothetical protein
VRVG